MSILAQEDPDEGWQKRKKTASQRSSSKLQTFLRKALVHQKTLKMGFKLAYAAYKLVEFVIQFF
jgi:hypothetical protein